MLILLGAGNAALAEHKHQQQELEAQQDLQILAYQLHKDKQEQVSCASGWS